MDVNSIGLYIVLYFTKHFRCFYVFIAENINKMFERKVADDFKTCPFDCVLINLETQSAS